MNRENEDPLISIKPFTPTSQVLENFCQEVTKDLEKYLDKKIGYILLFKKPK